MFISNTFFVYFTKKFTVEPCIICHLDIATLMAITKKITLKQLAVMTTLFISKIYNLDLIFLKIAAAAKLYNYNYINEIKEYVACTR